MRWQPLRPLIIVLLLGLLPTSLQTQEAAPSAEPSAETASRGEELTVYLMTMGPGPAVWERFGHNAIWISDSLRGTEIAYNYGMFSFEQENFLLRFIRGHMDYWMEGFDALLTANAYIRAGRSVWAQELNLTPAQRADLRDFLEWNALPENRFYRYDYYRDNCSTRVRDAIDRVLGGQIREQTGTLATGTTYRQHTRRLTSEDPLLYTGLQLGLGQPVDVEISAWEEMFLPMELRDWVREITIADASGARIPLVRSEEAIFLAPADMQATAPAELPDRFAAYLFVGMLLGGGILVTGFYAGRRRDASTVFRILVTGWCGIAGLLGLVLVALWAFTDHSVAYRNENLFFVNPLLLVLAILLPVSVGRSGRSGRAAWIVAAAIGALTVAGVLVELVPGFYQENAEIVALALPINLALVAAAWRLRKGGEGPERAGAGESRIAEPIAA